MNPKKREQDRIPMTAHRTPRVHGAMGEPILTSINKRPWLHVLLIVSLGLIAYANTFHAPFFFDDEPSIVFNPIIKNLDNFLFSSRGYEYAPRRFISYLTFAVNYKLGGLDVTGYHVFNLAVHITNALLLYALLLLTFRTPSLKGPSRPFYPGLTALCASVLFVVHPLQTQAVTYIVQRLASLATMFSLLALCLYIQARLLMEGGKPVARKAVLLYILSLVSTILAMKTKEIAFTLPIIVVLYEFFFLRATTRNRLLVLTPMLLTLLIIPASLVNVDQPLGAILSDVSDVTRVQSMVSRGDYLLTQFSVVTTYIRLLFLPVRQNIDYDYPIAHSLLSPSVFFSFAFLLALLAIGIYLATHSPRTDAESGFMRRLVSFGIFWFFITLSVESSIIPIEDVIFEHRVYLPSIGFFIAFIGTTGIVTRRLKVEKAPVAITLVLMFILTSLVLTTATLSRNGLWRDNLLWKDAAEKSPVKARPHFNAGKVYDDEGRFEEAMRKYQTAVRLKPDYAEAHSNLGLLYGRQGRFGEAIQEFQTAIAVGFQRAEAYKAYNNLGIVYAKQGHFSEAIREFQRAIQLGPESAEVHKNIGIAYSYQGRLEEAFKEFQTALRIDPGHAEARYHLERTYEKLRAKDR